MIDKVYIPIYEYTWMHPYYEDEPNSYTFFPSVGQKIKDDVVCCLKIPKESLSGSHADLKSKVQNAIKNMSMSNLLSMNALDNTKFVVDKIKTKLPGGTVTGIKVHKLKQIDTIDMVSKELQDLMENLYRVYATFIVDTYKDLTNALQTDYAVQLLKRYYAFSESKGIKGDLDLHNICYLIELEVSKEEKTVIGDKLANRFANKGVISLILPDELRPIAEESNKPIDLICNPFSVFSRMNLGQILEGVIAKTVMRCDEHIKEKPGSVKSIISWLNNSIIENVDYEYSLKIQEQIINRLDDDNFKNRFLESIQSSNLFIEAPSFAEVKIREILKNAVPYRESVFLTSDLIKFMKQKLKVSTELPNRDVHLKKIFCAPIYIQKLYKLASKSLNARDLGPVRSITKQPLKGRSKSGGSKIGQMEIESILASGCDLSIKELLSVKSDWSGGKKDLMYQLVESGEYHLPGDREITSRTKEVVDIQLQFLKE